MPIATGESEIVTPKKHDTQRHPLVLADAVRFPYNIIGDAIFFSMSEVLLHREQTMIFGT